FRTHPHRLPTHFVLGFAGQFPGINLFHAQYSTTNRYLIAGLITSIPWRQALYADALLMRLARASKSGRTAFA
ncbi:hypothetical protein, partial [Azonexus fungiphilus]|uniref:hypothetical protein n=1 Tax=Azonexus fungiphilus TaxID=146940 RepID=UPI001C2BDF95